MKCMQEERSSGSDVVFVRSCNSQPFLSDSDMVQSTHSNIYVRDVADNVVLSVQDRQRCDPFVVHELERIGQRLVTATYD